MNAVAGPSSMSGSEPAPPGSGRVTVLFLGGQARSGSTLLDRALGQMPGFLSAGEVRYLWDRGLRDAERCGCSEPFSRCPFWTEVGMRAFGGWDRLDLEEVLRLQREVGGAGAMPQLVSPVTLGRFRRKLERFGSYLDRVYEGIAATGDVPVVIDSSMSPPYALV